MNELVISYFGCIDKKYSRNKTTIEGLRQASVVVHEVIVNTPLTLLNSKKDLGKITLLKRILRKFAIIPEIVKKRKLIGKSNAIFVGYPGQFDLPFAYLAAKIFRKKLIFDPVILMFNALSNDVEVIDSKGLYSRLLKMFEMLVMRFPDLIIASTIEQKQFFVRKIGIKPSKIAVAYLAADDKIYKPSFPLKTDNLFRAVYYGLYSPLHGLPHIIKAAKLCEDQKNIVFQFIGKGKLYDECKEQIEKEGITNIELYPEVSEENASELLARADVFFGFMQNNETVSREIPNKVYQGIAMGKAVLTSESPAINSVFHNMEDIYLVPPANAKEISKAIMRLSKDRKMVTTISHNAYLLYVSRFTPKAIGEVMKSAIEAVVFDKTTLVSYKKIYT